MNVFAEMSKSNMAPQAAATNNSSLVTSLFMKETPGARYGEGTGGTGMSRVGGAVVRGVSGSLTGCGAVGSGILTGGAILGVAR